MQALDNVFAQAFRNPMGLAPNPHSNCARGRKQAYVLRDRSTLAPIPSGCTHS